MTPTYPMPSILVHVIWEVWRKKLLSNSVWHPMREPSLPSRRNKGHQLMIAKHSNTLVLKLVRLELIIFFSARANSYSDGRISIWQRKQSLAGCTMIKRPGSRSCRSPLRIEQQGHETDSVLYGAEWPNSQCAVLVGRIQCHRSVFGLLRESLSARRSSRADRKSWFRDCKRIWSTAVRRL